MYKFYLLRDGHRVIERPQFLYMRVAVAIHGTDIDRVLETYDLLSTRVYSPSTPILYSAGVQSRFLSSSFLYQPQLNDTMTVLSECVANFEEFWRTDGGVGLTLAMVPAQKYYNTICYIASR